MPPQRKVTFDYITGQDARALIMAVNVKTIQKSTFMTSLTD